MVALGVVLAAVSGVRGWALWGTFLAVAVGGLLGLILGLVLISAGLAATAAISIASPAGVTGVRLWVVALPFIGAAVAQFGPVHRLARSSLP